MYGRTIKASKNTPRPALALFGSPPALGPHIIRPAALRPAAAAPITPIADLPMIPATATPESVLSIELSPKKGGKTRKCKNDATFVWLNIWFKNEFEKLGWMVLARKKGYNEKVNAYINSVERLYHQLECKIRDTKDHDKKQDLMIMYKDVKCLMDHIHKDF